MLGPLEEHFGYVSDVRRMDKYREALSRVVRSGDVVADVGCGFGVLGLICLQSGASKVWGIDSSDAIEIARETMVRAGLENRYTCIRERSFRANLPEAVDVVVCDHVGYFGIDYGIIDTLADARRRFLKPGGRIVPSRIRLMLAGVNSPEIRAKAESWVGSQIPSEYHWLREYAVNTKHARMFVPAEIVTEPVTLGTVDLNADTPNSLVFQATLKVTEDCVLDGLAGWFDCELADDVWMTNSPLSDEQIDRLQIGLAFDEPIQVKAGDSLEVSVTIRHDILLFAWTVRDPQTGRQQKLSTWKSRILSDSDLARRASKPLALDEAAHARRLVWSYVDGDHTAEEIVQAVLRDHPALCPSVTEIRRFVEQELARCTR